MTLVEHMDERQLNPNDLPEYLRLLDDDDDDDDDESKINKLKIEQEKKKQDEKEKEEKNKKEIKKLKGAIDFSQTPNEVNL